MNAGLATLPAWATTGIGSVPFPHPAYAARHAVGSYDLPFCPQVPRQEGNMIEQWLGPAPGHCSWSSSVDAPQPRAWHGFLVALEHRWPEHGVAKIQCTGPITLADALMRSGAEISSHRELLVRAHEIAVWLAESVQRQVTDLRARGLTALLVVDEPSLAAVDRENCELVWDPLRLATDAWGLHLCCRVPWDVIDASEPDLLSFDISTCPIDHAAVNSLDGLIARGGHVAWGCVAPHHEEGAGTAIYRLDEAVSRLTAGREVVGSRSLISASCGSALVTEYREIEIVEALSTVAGQLRAEDRAAAIRRTR